MTDTTTAPTTAELVTALRALAASTSYIKPKGHDYAFCVHCSATDYDLINEHHDRWCPWAAARDLLARLDATGASGEEGKDLLRRICDHITAGGSAILGVEIDAERLDGSVDIRVPEGTFIIGNNFKGDVLINGQRLDGMPHISIDLTASAEADVTVDQVLGIFPNMTEGLSIEEYRERMWDEEDEQ